ncbi:hypothetical protein V7S43_016355 [Phytophthora oleae]|uniref:Uncharacterized protein n=1 Tax=Phytophthora oleae TaxID=2107226 RepID=A0ABD3EZW1_9STRA
MQIFAPLLLVCTIFSSGVVAKYEEETKTIDELYADAVAEGGNLVLYHGGDTPAQQTGLHDAFTQRFPQINFTAIVDYSKYHDVRIDNQLATDTLVPDVVASLKEVDGAWLAYSIFTFGYLYNSTGLDGAAPPATPANLTDPKWAGKIASTYPHDDDAALFLYTRYVEKYGWDWVSGLAQQNVSFNRDSNVASELVNSGEKLIGVGTGGGGAPIVFVGGNGTEYLSWGQRETQTTLVFNSVRTDINANKPWDVPEANMAAFPAFMEDRAKVEQWKQTFALYFGEVQGEPSPGVLGLHPGQ